MSILILPAPDVEHDEEINLAVRTEHALPWVFLFSDGFIIAGQLISQQCNDDDDYDEEHHPHPSDIMELLDLLDNEKYLLN